MVVTVVVTGVPRFMSLKDLAVEFNEVFEGEDLGDFRIRDIKLSSNKKHVALDFESGFDAMTVQEKLDGFMFETPESTYVIKAKIQNSLEEPQPGNEVVISTTFRQDYYKPAVEYQNESLDVEIDLLKKQRLAVKERRKLIKEQKKLKKEFTTLDVDPDNETPGTSKSSKRKRIRMASDSSDSADRPRTRVELSSPKSSDRSRRSRSRNIEDYHSVEYKKLSTARKLRSPEVSTKSRRSRSGEKRTAGYYALEYKEIKKIRVLKSPEPGPSSRRFSRSESRERNKSPSRILETHKRSRSREKYYSHKTIDYKKDFRTESPRFRSQHDLDHSKGRPTSSKQHRSPSPYKSERSIIDSRKRKSTHSRSRSGSPFTRKLVKTDGSKYKNRYSSAENTLYEKSRSKSELDDQRKAKTIEKKPPSREELAEINAAMQSKKRQAMEDVLFEMELSLKREQDTVTNSYKTFLSNLVKGIVQGRFQKLEVHEKMMVSDIVTFYRSQYSKEDDRTLLRNLAGECKSLDEISNTFVADSTVEVPQQSQQTHNDEIWSAVDEALDGVDIDSLQVEADSNEVQAKYNIKKEPKIAEQYIEKANSTDTDIHEVQAIESPKKLTKSTKNVVIVKANSIHTKIQNDILEVTEVPSESAIDLTDDIKVHDTKIHDNDVEEVQELVKFESIELSDDSDTEIENAKEVNVTSTINEGHVAINNIGGTGHITDVINLGNTEKGKQTTTISVKKEIVESFDLTNEVEDKEINNDHTNNDLSATNSVRQIKNENILTDVIDSITNPNNTDIVSKKSIVKPQTNLSTRIKEENIEVDLTSLTDDDDDEIVTRNDEPNPTTIDSSIVPSIKVEPDIDCAKPSETVIPNTVTVKQEHESTVTDSINLHDKPEIYNSLLDKNISISIKNESETSDANESKGDENSEMDKDTTNLETTISSGIKKENMPIESITSQSEKSEIKKDMTVPETTISCCIKKENVTIEGLTSQSKVNEINNDQITELINPSSLLQDNVATDNSASASQNEPINVKQEPIAMPVSAIIYRTVTTDPIDQSVATDNRCVQSIKKEHESAADKLNDSKTRTYKKETNSEDPNQALDKPSAQEVTDIEDGEIVEEGEIIDEPDTPVHHSIEKYVKINEENKSDGSKKDKIDKSKQRKRSSLEEQTEEIHSSRKIKVEKDSSLKYKENRYSFLEYYREERESSRYREERGSSIRYIEERDSPRRHREERGSSVRYSEEKESSRYRKESYSLTTHNEVNDEWYISKKHKANLKDDEDIETSSNVSNKPKINEQVVQEQSFIVSGKVPPANPLFILPTFIIMRGMKAIIKNQFNEHKYIYNITQKVLQARFRELLKDKGYYVKAKGIAKMYKKQYAKENYTDFLNGVVADIKAGKYDDEIKIIAMRHDKLKKKEQSTEEKEQSILAEKEQCTSEQKKTSTFKQKEQSTLTEKGQCTLEQKEQRTSEQTTLEQKKQHAPEQKDLSTPKLKEQSKSEQKEQSALKVKEQSISKEKHQKKRSTSKVKQQSTPKQKEQSTLKQKKKSTSKVKEQSTPKQKEHSTLKVKEQSTSEQIKQSPSKVKEQSTPKQKEQTTSEQKKQSISVQKEQSDSKVKEQSTPEQIKQSPSKVKEQSTPKQKEQTT